MSLTEFFSLEGQYLLPTTTITFSKGGSNQLPRSSGAYGGFPGFPYEAQQA